ncbi:sigma-54-dependent transcriptional regulator [Pseudodesulfovibrio indicus]|jgi:two-component system response regulator HydG|uniref:Transcriptional regulator n=1 Tax=Pseudodesulfovibrio indicus TaxID=1716143 RepID=A0A126QN57_9BACT|nr:sigma-54 dependent transcriptional regulator [Pseudodesulfovibrio indicus]AMK11259.1 transcriptional regulator [Pseudodesulfovibrio indicus]TDT92292.1 two-component system response regulator HydG [Pseudodesulfovibrio indicus]
MSGSILIVDDDKAHLSMLETIFSGWGYTATGAEDGADAIEEVRERSFDCVLMDVRMANIGGIEALQRIHEYNPSIPVIIMTAYSSVDVAVEAMKLGAYDYLTKPLNFDELRLVVERSLEHMSLAKENRSLKLKLSQDSRLGNIIGSSEVMLELTQMVETVAPTEATVLITGESGTGKELFARAIHDLSDRKDNELVTVNCAALTDTLLESELFGHEKGAFTGADKRREGRFMQANKGTIFLDEVGEVPMPMQAKLLRAIQEREIQRVGSDIPIHVDVRIIAATNRDLLDEVKEGKFREDLYYRLNVVNLTVPALVDRDGDVALLAKFFLDRFADKNRKKMKGFTPAAMNLLVKYPWPGNVRELENSIERAVILSVGDYITERDFPASIKDHFADVTDNPSMETMAGLSLDDIEKIAIIETLSTTKGNKSEAAKLLGITRTTLNNKIKKYEVEIEK